MTTKAQTSPTAEIEWDVVSGENTEFAAKYARMQWNHGSKQAAGFTKTGGLFISKEEYPNFNGEGFADTSFVTRDGDEIAGYGATSTSLAVIRIKHQWVPLDGKNVPFAHALCVVKGCEDLICISLKGPSKALDFQKTFNQHIGQNVALANRTRPQGTNPLEPFALWFPLNAGELSTAKSKDGKSTSVITPFEMATPETLDREYVASLWVGRDNYQRFAGYYRETSAWQKVPIWEQRNGDGDAEIHDTPSHTGDRITQQQAEFVAGLMETKGVGMDDLKQMCLTVTDGQTSNIDTLTRAEAGEITELLKAF